MENKVYVSTKEKAAAIKKAIAPVFGRSNVSVTKGSGTAAHWIHTDVLIPVPTGCSCENPGISWGDKMCATCRTAYNAAEAKMNELANQAVKELGGFSSYYSDDYADSSPYDCHLAQVKFIRPEPRTVSPIQPVPAFQNEVRCGFCDGKYSLQVTATGLVSNHRCI